MWQWHWPSPAAVARWAVAASWSADGWPSSRPRGSRRCVRTHLPAGSHPGWYRTSREGTEPAFQPPPSGRWGYGSATCPVIWSTAEAPAMEIISLVDAFFDLIKRQFFICPFILLERRSWDKLSKVPARSWPTEMDDWWYHNPGRPTAGKNQSMIKNWIFTFY